MRRLSGDTRRFSLQWCSAWGQLRAILSGRLPTEGTSIRGMVRRSRRALVATDERAILTVEEECWTAVFAEVGNHCIRGLSFRCLGRFSATRRNCGRAPSSARCQGDSVAVPGGCELSVPYGSFTRMTRSGLVGLQCGSALQ